MGQTAFISKTHYRLQFNSFTNERHIIYANWLPQEQWCHINLIATYVCIVTANANGTSTNSRTCTGNATHHLCSSILPLSVSYRFSNRNESCIVNVPAFTSSQSTIQLSTIHFERYRINGNWIVIYRSLNFRVEIRFRSEKKNENEIKSADIIRSIFETQISNDHRFWYTCCTKFCYHQAITVERTTLVKNGVAIFFTI